ncbi:MAG: hypothetical protein JSU86_11225 [Phycisphaerales bacterium]|nr:MAG: hypothetical protein JSU86_11225 [Phycisphaerales bacterium]
MGNVAVEVGVKALAGLLDEFARGNIVDPKLEREGLDRHAKELSDRWDQKFRGFPEKYFPFTSFRGEYYRGKRDEHLKKIITGLVTRHDDAHKTIVNPACVFGRHTRDLASRLKAFRVIGTDIDPNWNRLYERVRGGRNPENFQFIRDNIFDPQLDVRPTAVVFFGACGSVSDGIIDYAIDSHSAYLMCRTCCHDNIGGNTEITKRFTYLNLFFRFKNWGISRMRGKEKYAGFYFSDRYSRAHYPRSEAARGVSNSDEFLEVSRNSVESDICRAIIDLDRYLRLVEKGYNVWYRGELFVAEKTVEGVGGTCCAGRT